MIVLGIKSLISLLLIADTYHYRVAESRSNDRFLKNFGECLGTLFCTSAYLSACLVVQEETVSLV